LCSAQCVDGDENDLIRLSKKMLNKTSSTRIISKQECMVENTELPLSLCSDFIQVVGITGSSRITANGQGSESMITSYANRLDEFEEFSLCRFVHHCQPILKEFKVLVPHFVGLNNTPTFPVSPSYARSCLIVHCPWRNMKFHKLDDKACISQFLQMMERDSFPKSVKLSYMQAKNRYEADIRSAMVGVGDDSKNEPENVDDLDDEDDMVLKCMARLPGHSTSADTSDLFDEQVNSGQTYDWSKRCTVSDLLDNELQKCLIHV
jgi:hypothetical protein